MEKFEACCSDRVAFAEVECIAEQVLAFEKHNMGFNNSLPTIKVFNKLSGPGGSYYTQRTNMELCEELSHKYTFMEEWVEFMIGENFYKSEL